MTQKIKPKKIYEEVSDIIINRVKQGELAPGDRLESVEKWLKILVSADQQFVKP